MSSQLPSSLPVSFRHSNRMTHHNVRKNNKTQSKGINVLPVVLSLM